MEKHKISENDIIEIDIDNVYQDTDYETIGSKIFIKAVKYDEKIHGKVKPCSICYLGDKTEKRSYNRYEDANHEFCETESCKSTDGEKLIFVREFKHGDIILINNNYIILHNDKKNCKMCFINKSQDIVSDNCKVLLEILGLPNCKTLSPSLVPKCIDIKTGKIEHTCDSKHHNCKKCLYLKDKKCYTIYGIIHSKNNLEIID